MTDATSLLGWWQLVSCEVEYQASGERQSLYGAPARGYILFAPEGRMMTVIEADPPASRSMGYTGRYEVNGDQWRTHVDVASGIEWAGSVQERFFHFESGLLHVCSAWCASPLHQDEIIRARLVWQRADHNAVQR
jgi:hypothetical protein